MVDSALSLTSIPIIQLPTGQYDRDTSSHSARRLNNFEVSDKSKVANSCMLAEIAAYCLDPWVPDEC